MYSRAGRFGPTIDVDAASTTFVDLDITDEGRWEVDPNIIAVPLPRLGGETTRILH